MFAAVALLCVCGMGLYGGLALASRIILRRWRDENSV
jgi:ABC-type nitrate/sulfonate/bicarbonate transport system permease component